MAKKVMAIAKLQIPAGKAMPGPPVGPSLAQYGINIMEFVKQYNAAPRIWSAVCPRRDHHLPDRTFPL